MKNTFSSKSFEIRELLEFCKHECIPGIQFSRGKAISNSFHIKWGTRGARVKLESRWQRSGISRSSPQICVYMTQPTPRTIPYQNGIEEEHKIQYSECKKDVIVTVSKIRNKGRYSPRCWWLRTGMTEVRVILRDAEKRTTQTS